MEKGGQKDKGIDYAFITRIFSWATLFIFSIFFVVLTFLFNYGVVVREISFNANASVINISQANITKLGVSVDPDKLVFGVIPLDGNVTREISLKAPSNARKSKIKIIAEGNISNKLVMDKKEVILLPGESLSVKMKFIGSEVGNYTGVVHVFICTARYGLAEGFLTALCDKALEDWEKEHIKIS